MKKFYLLAFFSLLAVSLFAKDGYHIQLKLTDRKDSMVYLAHYNAKPFPTIYKADSAKLDSKGNAVFDKKEKIVRALPLTGEYLLHGIEAAPAVDDLLNVLEILMHGQQR